MSQAFSGVVIAALIGVCWLLRRPRPRLLRSTDVAGVAALNCSQMERLVVAEPQAAEDSAGPAPALSPLPLPKPGDGRSRQALLTQLERQFQAGGQQRRQAMAVCGTWNHQAVLPLLRRGLRDADPSVVAIAATAMARFRGRGIPRGLGSGGAQPARLPRNVSRTR